MEKVINRKFFICILTVVVTYTFIFADAIVFRKYTPYDGYQCVPGDTLFQSGDVSDALKCGKLCHETKNCLSFSYRPDDKRCIGCRVDIFGAFSAVSQIVPGSVHFSNPDLEADCYRIHKENPSARSGVHRIKLWKSKTVIDVYCDMGYYWDGTDRSAGWTVFQNRFDGSVNFDRDCKDYENGFGSLTGEFWLGLKYMDEIASAGLRKNRLRINLSRQSGERGYEIISNFGFRDDADYELGIDADNLGIEGFSSGITTQPRGRSYGIAPFSCKDRDRDEMAVHCAADRHGAWWHQGCSEVNLNGDYCTPGQVCNDGNDGKTGFYHKGFAGYESLNSSKMMIREKPNF